MAALDPGEAETLDDRSGTPSVGYAAPAPAGPVAVPNAPPGRVDWVVIIVRIVAIWFLFTGIPLVFGLPLLFAGDGALPLSYRLSVLAPSGVSLGLGIVLWVSARGLARRILADVPPADVPLAGEASAGASSSPSQPLSVAEVQAVCFSVVGVIIAALALRILPQVFSTLQDSDGRFERTGVDRRNLFQFLIEAATGAGLFFGARGLGNLWQRVRSGPDADAGMRGDDRERPERPDGPSPSQS